MDICLEIFLIPTSYVCNTHVSRAAMAGLVGAADLPGGGGLVRAARLESQGGVWEWSKGSRGAFVINTSGPCVCQRSSSFCFFFDPFDPGGHGGPGGPAAGGALSQAGEGGASVGYCFLFRQSTADMNSSRRLVHAHTQTFRAPTSAGGPWRICWRRAAPACGAAGAGTSTARRRTCGSYGPRTLSTVRFSIGRVCLCLCGCIALHFPQSNSAS